MKPDLPPRMIELAHEAPFWLRHVEVRPASREVMARGRREVLQPRVMQVLAALARRRGEVVSRDDLIQACWGGRVVGEDAINRCISRIRGLAGTLGGFHVATIPRVGYRLSEVALEPASPGRWFARRWPVLAGLLALVLAGAACGAWWYRAHGAAEAAQPPRIVVLPLAVLGSDPTARAFAATLADEISGVLNENGIPTALPGKTGAEAAAGADLAVRGAVSAEGGVLRVRTYLEDTRAKLTLWSGQAEGPVRQSAALRDTVAVRMGEAIYIAMEPLQQEGLRLDAQTLALHIKGSEALKTPVLLQEGDALRAFEQAVARAPDFAIGRGDLAIALVRASGIAPAAERGPLQRRARLEAQRAIRSDPSAGSAYDALYQLRRLQAPRDIAKAEDQLLVGLARAPDFPFLHMRECRLLVEVGRARDSLPYCQRAMALRPLAAPISFSYAHALHIAGDPELAASAIATAARFHPDHLRTNLLRFDVAAFGGSPDDASALLHNPTSAPEVFRPDAAAALDLFLKARRTGARADIDRALQALWAAGKSGSLDGGHLVMGAATLGRIDDAFAAMHTPGVMFNFQEGTLFEPVNAPLWRDRRFWREAADRGLVDYWRTRNQWPDFCAEPTLPFDCRVEAARAAAARPTPLAAGSAADSRGS